MAQDAADPRRTRQYTLLLGEGEKYPRLMARYTETLVEPRRNVIRSVLRRGIETGQIRPDIDIEIAMLTLTGTAMSRGKCEKAEPDAECEKAEPDAECEKVERNAGFAERVVDSLLLGLAPR